jgi:hypothetical protein
LDQGAKAVANLSDYDQRFLDKRLRLSAVGKLSSFLTGLNPIFSILRNQLSDVRATAGFSAGIQLGESLRGFAVREIWNTHSGQLLVEFPGERWLDSV